VRRVEPGNREGAGTGDDACLAAAARALVAALALAALLAAPPAHAAPQEPLQEPPPAPQQEAPDPAEAPIVEAQPRPGISFEELLAAEDAAAADEAEALARRSRLPFQARSQPLQGLPAGMAALIMGSRPGGQVVSSVLALPLGHAVEPPPAPPPSPETEAGSGAAPAPTAAPAETGPPRELVVLMVEIDGPSLLGPNPGDTAQLEVFAYALGGNGGVRGFLSQRLPLDLAEVGEALFAGGVKLIGHLELPPGEYVLRVLVHETASQRYGLRAVPLTVPAGAALSPPLAAEPASAAASPWLLVVESPHGRLGAVDFGELLHQAGTPLPSALPLLPGDDAELDVLVTAGAAVGERLEARLLDRAGEPAARLPATVLARRATDLPGFDRLRVRLPLDELAVGSYFLTLAGEVDGRAVVSAELPLVVTRDGTAGEVLWTDVERRLSGGEAGAALELDEGEGRRRRSRRNERAERAVAAAYRAVLERLADGDREGAATDLARIESEVLAGVRVDPFAVLTGVEDDIQTALAAADPEALLPIALLHADVYRRQRADHTFGLATRSRSQSVAAVERYAAGSQIDEAESFASAILATLGDELQRAQVRVAARLLLERASAMDPDNSFALLHLAAGHEKAADYAGAVDVLRRLIAADPKAPEARLRLAVNLLRLGQNGEAIALLGSLIGEDNPEWVLTLAYEALAGERLRGGDAAGAAELLRRGAGRLPRQPRLKVQLAYALERAGRSAEAADVLAQLDASAAAGPSPRHQYNLWPEGGRDELERRLVQAGLVRLPRLATALDALPGERSR
jgi:thioredoxin-like negative regulator of GroEL